MYDATQRATYADLFKAAEAKLSARVADALSKAVSSGPVAAALTQKGGR